MSLTLDPQVFEDTLVEKIPPHSMEAEQALLGALLLDGDALNRVVELLKPADFYATHHQYIYDAALDLFNRNEPIDIISVSETLNEKLVRDGRGRPTEENQLDAAGGRAYINDLAIGTLSTANIQWYAQKIRDYALLRKLISVGGRIGELAFAELEAKDAVDKAQSLVFEMAQTGMPMDLSHIRDVLPTTFAQIEERCENKGSLMGISCGFYELDTMLSGLQRSDLLILAARPSMGKTAFCLNIASHVALREKKPVLIFSLEMSKEQLVTRILCSEAEMDAQKLRTGHITEQDFGKLSRAMGLLGDAPLYIDDTAGMTIMELRAKARKLKAEAGDIGLIVIDYLQLMEGSGGSGGGGDNRVQVISAISRGLKGIAREIKAPVIALSQLSRAVESRPDKRPMLSDLRESGSIEQDADVVFFIYRDEYYNPQSEKPGIADIIVAKQRNGPVGQVELLFRNNWTKFLNPADKKIQIF